MGGISNQKQGEERKNLPYPKQTHAVLWVLVLDASGACAPACPTFGRAPWAVGPARDWVSLNLSCWSNPCDTHTWKCERNCPTTQPFCFCYVYGNARLKHLSKEFVIINAKKQTTQEVRREQWEITKRTLRLRAPWCPWAGQRKFQVLRTVLRTVLFSPSACGRTRAPSERWRLWIAALNTEELTVPNI